MQQLTDIITRYFDSTVTVSTDAVHGISQFSKKLGTRKEMGVNMMGDDLSFTFIFPKEELFNAQNYVYSKYFEITERGNHLILHRPADKNREINDLVKAMLSLKSVIFHNSYLENGRYSFSFMFNSVELKKVSDILLEFKRSHEDLRLEYLGPSKPFFENSPLNTNKMVAVIQSLPPSSETGNKKNPMGSAWLRMIKMSYGTEKVDGVYLLREKNRNITDITEIVKGKMYTITTENRVLEYLTRRFNEEHVVTQDQIHLFQQNNFIVYYTLQNLFRNDFIRIFNEVRGKFPDWNFSLLLLQNLFEYLDSNSYLDLMGPD